MTEVAVKHEQKTETKPSAVPAPSSPRNVWRSFREEMDRLFDSFPHAMFPLPRFRRTLLDEPFQYFETSFGFGLPAVDAVEKGNVYEITAELAGLDEKDIELVLSGDVLTIKGEKSEKKEEKDKTRYLSERRYGAFQRSFTLPDGVDRDKIEATFKKGVLTVVLPKSAQAINQQKKIPITSK